MKADPRFFVLVALMSELLTPLIGVFRTWVFKELRNGSESYELLPEPGTEDPKDHKIYAFRGYKPTR